MLQVYEACTQRTAIRFIDEVRHRLPFRIQVVQTDNVAESHADHSHTRSDTDRLPSRGFTKRCIPGGRSEHYLRGHSASTAVREGILLPGLVASGKRR